MFEESLKFDEKDNKNRSEEKGEDGVTMENNYEHQLERLSSKVQ